MGALAREIRAVQNPALGATIITSAARGYADAGGVHAGMPLPLTFLVLPIILHASTSRMITSTLKKSGLRYFVEKFSQSKVAQSDLVLAIQRRATSMRPLTFESLDIALQTGLAILDSKKAEISGTDLLEKILARASAAKSLHSDSEKLGYWMGQLTPFELSVILKVAF
jgi:hypothetical protein